MENLMKGLSLIGAVALLTAASSPLWASSISRPPQVVTEGVILAGPVESINAKTGVVTVLGQKLRFAHPEILAVGEALSVAAQFRVDGSLGISNVADGGAYVAGASPVFLTGVVQKVQASIGRVQVNGVEIDF